MCSYLTLSVSSALPEQRPALSQPFSSALGYLPAADEAPPIGLRRARLQSPPSSCYSEWDSSLWNTWSSLTDGDTASARTSLISSVDSCYTGDSASFARLLAAAAETMSGASVSGEQRSRPLFTSHWCSLKRRGASEGSPQCGKPGKSDVIILTS